MENIGKCKLKVFFLLLLFVCLFVLFIKLLSGSDIVLCSDGNDPVKREK